MRPEVSTFLHKLFEQYGQHLQISDYDADYEGGEETWLRDMGANISLKILQLTLSEICEENQRLSKEKRNNNNDQSFISKSAAETHQVNGVSELKGVDERLSASELTEVVNNPSQMIEDPVSQDEERPSLKKKKFRTVYKSSKEEQKELRRRESRNKSLVNKPVPGIKENGVEVILIDNEKGRTPKKNKVLVPETMQFQMTPSLLEREKPRIPDTPEKRGDLLYPINNRLKSRPDRTEKAEQELIQLADKMGWTKQDQVQREEKVRVDKVEKIPGKVTQRRDRTRQEQEQGVEKARGDQEKSKGDRQKVRGDQEEDNVSSKLAHVKEKTRSDKVLGVEKVKVWDKTEQEEAPSQRIESSSGEPEAELEIDERSTSPVFYRSKFGSGNTERLKDISGKRKGKRDLVVPGSEKDLGIQIEPRKSSRKSNNSISNVGTITPIDQHKVDRKTWENLDEDFLSKKVESPVGADTLCDESPNLMRTSRSVIPSDKIAKPVFNQPMDKENTKPKPKSKPKAENRWGMTVDPITESQQKKMKSEKQSTLDMFFNNKDGGGVKRTKSELERAIQLSKAEFETKNKPVASKAQSVFDDTMELLEQREHKRQMQNRRVPPPLTPPDFWDPCIVEGESNDPRNITQNGPPLRSRDDRRKEQRIKLQEQRRIVNGNDGEKCKPTASSTTAAGNGNSQSRLKRKRTETVNGGKTGNASAKAKVGTSKNEGSEDEFYFY